MNPPRTISWKEVTFLLWLTPVNLWHLPTILPSTSPRLFMSLKSRFCTFYRLFGQKLSCYLGSATAWARFAMGFGSVSLHQMEFWVHLYEINLEVRSCNPTSSCKWRVSVHEVLGKQIIRISFCEVSFFLIVLHFRFTFSGQCKIGPDSSWPPTEHLCRPRTFLPGHFAAFKWCCLYFRGK